MTHTHDFTGKIVHGSLFWRSGLGDRAPESPTCECGLSKAMHDYLKAKEEANEHLPTD